MCVFYPNQQNLVLLKRSQWTAADHRFAVRAVGWRLRGAAQLKAAQQKPLLPKFKQPAHNLQAKAIAGGGSIARCRRRGDGIEGMALRGGRCSSVVATQKPPTPTPRQQLPQAEPPQAQPGTAMGGCCSARGTRWGQSNPDPLEPQQEETAASLRSRLVLLNKVPASLWGRL